MKNASNRFTTAAVIIAARPTPTSMSGWSPRSRRIAWMTTNVPPSAMIVAATPAERLSTLPWP
jgi:hypothetical protein